MLLKNDYSHDANDRKSLRLKMKIIKNLKYSIILGLFFAGSASAFENAGGPRNYCKPAKFRDFSPPERVHNQPFIEVAPESIISVKAVGSIDPSSIRVFAKKIVLKPTIVDKINFFQITAKLPAELRSGYARIDLIAQADMGACIGKDGWLIKIKETVESPVSDDPVTTDAPLATENPAPAPE